MEDGKAYDWSLIGRNVRQARIIRGHSQEDLAQGSGVSVKTVYQVERGVPISQRSLSKLCAFVDLSLDSVRVRNTRVLSEDVDGLVYRRSAAFWMAGVEKRAKVPEDSLQRVQRPEERLRLGRLGLVPMFVSSTTFIMPEGPGVVMIELYGRFEEAFNAIIYRDCLLACVQGRARARIGETTMELDEGDIVGYRSKNMRWMEPAEGSALPVRLTWTGAVRIGTPPGEVKPGARVRRRRKGGEG